MEEISITKKLIAQNFNIPIIIGFTCFALFIMVVLFLKLYYENVTITFDREFLKIKTLFTERNIAVNTIKAEEIKMINLNIDKKYDIKPDKEKGSLIISASGWYKLKNGHEALLYMTNRKKIVLIPTLEYDILLSIEGMDNNEIEKIKNIINKKQDI
jgi:hypothetical protein